jgi:hypothetical protein
VRGDYISISAWDSSDWICKRTWKYLFFLGKLAYLPGSETCFVSYCRNNKNKMITFWSVE